MSDFWKIKTGAILTTLEERITTSYVLPLKDEFLPLNTSGVQISILNGTIPRGLRLVDAAFIGTPYEVAIDTIYTFTVRAELEGHVDDRTYSIKVIGPDDPVWVTPEDLLPIGSNNSLFIIDSVPVDFQLEAYDPDTIAGDTLEFYIQPKDGELPPGIQLTTDGRLVGVVEPILALEKAAASGNFDSNNYGVFPYDFGIRPDNGFDSFFYDVVIYDTSLPSRSPKKLNRFYEFIVSVSDGISIVKRPFRIYVVGDDFLRADNTIMQVGTGIFSADNTHIRVPIWLTPSDFGFRRANNYITLFLDVIDPNSLIGVITYSLQATNDDGSPSLLPPGLILDESNGEIAGFMPYQPAVTKEFKFTIRATRLVPNSPEQSFKDKTFKITFLGEIDSILTWNTPNNLGTINSNFVSTLSVNASSTVPNANLLYTFVNGKLPPGLSLNYDGEIIGKINSFGSVDALGLTVFDNNLFTLDNNLTKIDRQFNFTVRVQDNFGYSAITRDFSITVTDPDDKLYSNLYMQPFLKQTQRDTYELLISNNNIINSEIIYRPNDPAFGIQKQLRMLLYSGLETKESQYYVSAISKNIKRKKYKLGNVKTAVAKIPETTTVVYEVVYVEVIDPNEPLTGKTAKRIEIKTNNIKTVDNTMFEITPESVENISPSGVSLGTRGGDVEYLFYPNFIVGTRAGDILVKTNPIQVGLRTGFDLSVGTSIQGSDDPYRFRPVPENTVKVDSDAFTIDGNKKNVKYISNISNIRSNLRLVGETEREFLPLWMRSAQPGTIVELGYVPAIPICYCKPGTSQQVVTALKLAGVKFNQFNFDIDRIIIDSTIGNSQEQYIAFHNYEYNI